MGWPTTPVQSSWRDELKVKRWNVSGSVCNWKSLSNAQASTVAFSVMLPKSKFLHILCSAFISLWSKDVKLREAQRQFILRQSPWSICQKTAAHKVAGSYKAKISLCSVPFSLSHLSVNATPDAKQENGKDLRFSQRTRNELKGCGLEKVHVLIFVLLLAHPHSDRVSHNIEQTDVEWLPEEKRVD